MRRFPGFWILITVIIGFTSFLSAAEASDIRGAWRTETYNLKGGTLHQVEGLIFFTEKDWTVLFFEMGDDAKPKRGSGEGGTYTLDGEDLVFTHRYLLSAGQKAGSQSESPLRMEVHGESDGATEPCRVVLGGDSMTIYFPSGNHMTFRRSSR